MFLAILLSIASTVASDFSIAKCWYSGFVFPKSPQLKKCRLCEVDETGVMHCFCAENETIVSSLRVYSCSRNYAFPTCASEIEVNDGKLSCKEISSESTYMNSCFNCENEGTSLTCSCWKNFSRQHTLSSLDLKDCNAPVWSCDGVLTCGSCSPSYRDLIGDAMAFVQRH